MSVNKKRSLRFSEEQINLLVDEVISKYAIINNEMSQVMREFRILRNIDVTNVRLFHIFGSKGDEVFLVDNKDKVYAFGENKNGRLGLGHDKEVREQTIVPELSGKEVVKFVNSENQVIARTRQNEIYFWGQKPMKIRDPYLLPKNQDDYFIKPILNSILSKKNIVDIRCGREISIALSRSGKVYEFRNSMSELPRRNFHIQPLNSITKNFRRLKKINILPRKRVNEEYNFFHKVDFKKNIVAISCGGEHSLALTQSGLVYGWGSNRFGQLGISSRKQFIHKPKRIEIIDDSTERMQSSQSYEYLLSDQNITELLERSCHSSTRTLISHKKSVNYVVFSDITCGANHSILLSNSGDIFAFGSNKYGQLGIGCLRDSPIPMKILSLKKFTKIAAHPFYDISIAHSSDGVLNVWGNLNGDSTTYPEEMHHIKTFDQFFRNYCQITYSTTEFQASSHKEYIPNGKYESVFIELDKIGSGSFGEVFKVISKYDGKFYAIKKIETRDETDYLREISIPTSIQPFSNDFVVQNFDAWLENKDDSGKNFNLFIQMELCDMTLEDVVKNLNEDVKFKSVDSLTYMGYYIASELFIEIVEGVNFLHKQKIIHRDLKPGNILLKKGSGGRLIRIADFGLAKVLENESNTGDRGTIKYMAPEVVSCTRYNAKADIYSLGVIMQELLMVDIDK